MRQGGTYSRLQQSMKYKPFQSAVQFRSESNKSTMKPDSKSFYIKKEKQEDLINAADIIEDNVTCTLEEEQVENYLFSKIMT